MDEATLARMDEAARRVARRRWCPDPAVDAEDVAQAAWLRVLPRLTAERPEEEQTHYLLGAVACVAIDAQRRWRRRPRGEFGDWLPSGQDVEAEAIARAELGPILDRAVAGERDVLALVLLACGLEWREVMPLVGVSRATIWRWHRARGEVLA